MPERCDAEHPGALMCHEDPGHDDGAWHYDAIDDVTWRAGRHLRGGEAASADGILGSVETFSGDVLDVILDGEGDVTLSRRMARSRDTVLVPAERDKLRELLDRAAMPGQPAPGCVRLNCGHQQGRHDGSRPGSPCEDCGCQGWTPDVTEASHA